MSSTVPVTILTVMANLVGAGLLSLPYCLYRAGIIPGVITMIIAAVLNSVSMLGITKCCQMSQVYTYKDVGEAALGKRATTFINAVMAFYTLGSCVSFTKLLSDFVPSLICESGCGSETTVQTVFSEKYVIIPLVALVILYPLSLMRDLSSLKFTTTLSTVCILYTASMIVAKSAMTHDLPPVKLAGQGAGALAAFPILTVSFTLHYNVPKYFQELSHRSMKRMALVTAVAFGVVFVCYLATALGGYLTFGPNTNGDVLLNYPSDDVPATIARIALSLILIGCYPLAFNSFRNSVTSLLPDKWAHAVVHGVGSNQSGSNTTDSQHSDQLYDSLLSNSGSKDSDRVPLVSSHHSKVDVMDMEHSVSAHQNTCGARFQRAWIAFWKSTREDWPHALLTKLLVSISVGIGLGVPNIATVLTYKGAIGGSMVVYIFPAWMYFALMQRRLHAPVTDKLSVNSGDVDDPKEHLGPFTWTWRDLVTTQHGLLAVCSSTLGLFMMISGIATSQSE